MYSGLTRSVADLCIQDIDKFRSTLATVIQAASKTTSTGIAYSEASRELAQNIIQLIPSRGETDLVGTVNNAIDCVLKFASVEGMRRYCETLLRIEEERRNLVLRWYCVGSDVFVQISNMEAMFINPLQNFLENDFKELKV